MDKYDVAIIGSGPGGYVAAIKGGQMGAKVCLIEKGEVGGTCLNKGCIPTKTLITSLGLYERIKAAAKHGITIEGKVSLDINKLFDRKDQVVSNLVKGVRGLLKANGVTIREGEGSLVARDRVRVTDSSGNSEELEAGKIIIATGSKPFDIPGMETDGERIIDSDRALEMREAPEGILIVGAGVIGSEFAFIYNSMGSQVTMVELLPRAIPMEDEDMSALLEREFKKRKIKLHTGRRITSLNRGSGGKVEAVMDNGEKVQADKVLVSIGRGVNLQGIPAGELGIKQGDKGAILVNERMETSVDGIYAIGDVVGGKMLAHVASAEGLVAVANALGEEKGMSYGVIPSVIFTDPEIASVGLTEKGAREEGFGVKIGRFPFRALGKAQSIGEIEGEVKIVSDARTDQILGVHIMGAHASDLIHEAAVAMRLEATAEDLAETIHAHPTLSEALMEAGHDLLGGAIHSPKR